MIGPFKGDYFFLSNFYTSLMRVDGALYTTVEHYYQASKAYEWEDSLNIRIAESPSMAKQLGRSVRMSPDFEATKRLVMLNGVTCKFAQNPSLREKLIATGDELLEEVNYWGDTYWGTVNGVGENWLGRILMTVREAAACT